jgi:lipopolysaccharide/colanic/teichoic acid biosynthesis glycosyltransferase
MNDKIDDYQLRELLIKRYAGMDRSAPRHLLRFYLKRASWFAVVEGTHLFKRVLDVVFSVAFLAILLPLLLLVAVAIWLENPGPVLRQQNRVGRWGKPFSMWSFRTTAVDKAESGPDRKASGGEGVGTGKHRPTRIGTLISTLGIDELPQLVNVLMGDMSLVGPRPPLPQEVDRYSLADRCRLEIPPGIWQGAGQSEGRFDRLVELDLQYHQSKSLWTDFKVLGMLMALILSGGGYSATVAASTNDQTQNAFRYDTSHWTAVDITLAGTDGNPALLSFYSEGPNGLRLLENAFTDTQGRYSGDMRLPAHLSQVVVMVRTGDRQDTLTLPIVDESITYFD